MPHARKRDQKQIIAKLDELAARYKSDARSWWPKFVFHYSELQNVVSILESGVLLSRSDAVSRGLLQMDSASQSVLLKTRKSIKDCVRLYFRPKTPTQYSNEGIRPRNNRRYGSHCPIPVMLLFDSRDILTRKSTQFSRGSLAGYMPGQRGSRASFFENLPFQRIYHNAGFRPEEKRKIIASRHAEVIVPKSLDLDALKYIWCRSDAERCTLISLLSERTRRLWEKKIFFGSKYDLFFAEWAYVDRVNLGHSVIEFSFNSNARDPDKFELKARLEDRSSGQTLRAIENEFVANKKIVLKFENPISHYSIDLWMDECLAYHGYYRKTDDVF